MKAFTIFFLTIFISLSCSIKKQGGLMREPYQLKENFQAPGPTPTIVNPIVASQESSGDSFSPFLYIILGSIILCCSLSLLNLNKRIKKSAIN